MLTRRQTVVGAAVGTMAPTWIAHASTANYDEAVASIWRHSSAKPGDPATLMRELVRYATLAPSSHNTQCWKFRLQERAIAIEPDLSRRCPAVDPDDHHLYVSLESAPAVASPLFQAIVERQCTRGDYDAKPVSSDELRLLEQAGSGKGVRIMLFTERPAMEKVLEYVVAGNSAQMRDPAFMKELKTWIRFNKDQAVLSGDGLFSGSSGNPNVPPWLGSPLMNLFFTEKSETEKYTRHIRSSAGIAVFVSDTNDKAHWTETGRCYKRFALQATVLGIRNAFLNQPVEVTTIRRQFAAWLGVSNLRPDLVVRFGRGPKMPQSLRRPVQAVLI
jgi:hypothetical protein